MADVTFSNLASLIPVLAATYGTILGAITLGIGWQVFSSRMHPRYWRGAQDATGQDRGSVR